MERRFQIGEIAKMFDIASSKLRYWESQGILAGCRNKKNGYREYDVSDLMTISDVIFYQSLGLSLKHISEIELLNLPDHNTLCQQQMAELQKQQQEIEGRIRKLQWHIDALNEITFLREKPYTLETMETLCIVPFELIEIEKLRQYIENPYLYSRVQHTKTLPAERRGLAVPTCEREQYPEILWHGSGTFAVCLMREQICPGYPNDLQYHMEQIQKSHQTGYIISRFLTCGAENGIPYDFYKTYIEITE
ncbi:DNA-binding transcriptional MerR regulator [Frisingicoccus caecimuris]|uniref:DNA-binding transcriptional MerR regulator n=2 Tax=Frisingicoccus caecimuris TaxID=1796636 RepID=A0A4R2LN43_9FIRM|nr:DNA-binding transcriptional MerR regulator [Frisingicoccus caecimuris]